MEVLACPHCDRLFQVTSAALGKKIRCRGCRGIFYVPKDTSSVPLGPQEAMAALDDMLTPLAIPCMIDGHDARSCPECGRTFRMKESFAGKTIRCRGCKVTFRVRATKASPAERVRPEAAPVEANREAALPAPPQPVPAGPVMRPPPPPSTLPPPTIFEDMGDVLDDLLPGDKVPPVVRPRNVTQGSPPPNNSVVFLVAVVLGGVCAGPVTLVLLRFISRQQFEKVASMLPEFLVGWLR